MELLKRIVEVGFVLALAYLLTGCHTVSGFGEDLKKLSSPYTTE